MTQRIRPLAALAISAAFALLYVLRADTLQGPAAVATPTLTSSAVATASPAPSPSSAGTPTASSLPQGTFENKVLGYRITRSVWKERDRSSVIDLYLHEADGRWIWSSAEPQDGWPCRRPWVSKDSC